VGEDPGLAELIRRVRGGDEHAARELVQRWEPAIRRAVRFRLRDQRLRRLIEGDPSYQNVRARERLRSGDTLSSRSHATPSPRGV
jgi:RNA polymerase sigma-70 factor (ECF subfamily)